VFILVGLGNPGRRYQFTRHNIGFLFLDYIAEKFSIPFSAGKGDYFFGHGIIEDNPVQLVKPTTYMNHSGLVLNQLGKVLTENLSKLIIIYDDFHLNFGTIRFRSKGSDAGHNGLKSVIYCLETDVFPRLKLGIGSEFENPIDFVLSKFDKHELDSLPKLFDCALEGIKTWMQLGIDSAMNNHNGNVLTTR
jgi:peptidyl-tRNA hydrolase, PTH1 family